MDLFGGQMKEVYDNLCEIGCCKICILRFLGETDFTAFVDSKKTLVSKGLEKNENGCCKIQKNNPCIACLGLLEKSVMDDTVQKISEEITKEGYDSKTFNVAITLPVSFQIRAHAVWMYLINNFPKFCTAVFPLNLVTIHVKDVWKWIVGPQIAKAISKTYVTSSDFSITLSFYYSDDDSEANSLTEMGYTARKGGRRQRSNVAYSRKSVDDFLGSVSEENFKNHFNVPPNIPTQSVYCDSVSLHQNSIHFAGRYNKFIRNLPQTPWLIDGERRVENSIQELISNRLVEITKSESLKFSASGREDVDVRTLGRGRPFAIEFVDPKRTCFSFLELRDVEKKINFEGLGKIAIRDLQLVDKEDLKVLKQGEEHKTKTYCAYCIVFGELPKGLEKLPSLIPLNILQKTPIRVLHRRPFAVRPRIIHSMKAVPQTPSSESNGQSFFKLYVTTQAGTYVKEFVHGDFGRTHPCLGDLLGGVNVDILALDVENVVLDWPPPVKYNDKNEKL